MPDFSGAALRLGGATKEASSCPMPLDRLDLEAGVEQSLNDDFSRSFGVKNRDRKVGAAEKVDQHIFRGELAHAAPPSSLAFADLRFD